MTDPDLHETQDSPAQAEAPGVERDARAADAAPLVDEQLLVEDVSIDGMCGVY